MKATGKLPLQLSLLTAALVTVQPAKAQTNAAWTTLFDGHSTDAELIVKGYHVEHWLNGAKIVEYELGSPALKAMIAKTKFKDWPKFAKAETGHIALQNHGGEVWFRNIRIRRL